MDPQIPGSSPEWLPIFFSCSGTDAPVTAFMFLLDLSQSKSFNSLKLPRNVEVLQKPFEEGSWFRGVARYCLQISNRKLTPSSFIGPRISTAMVTKSYLCLTPVYFALFRSEASFAAAPLSHDVFGKCDCARVSGMVKSKVMDLPHCHGMSMHPSTRLSVPSRVKPFGSFCDGTCALMSALCMMVCR